MLTNTATMAVGQGVGLVFAGICIFVHGLPPQPTNLKIYGQAEPVGMPWLRFMSLSSPHSATIYRQESTDCLVSNGLMMSDQRCVSSIRVAI
jgi:uncharacterized protein YigE (DUF2233 family)